MATIKAKGKVFGRTVEVECTIEGNELVFDFDGKENELLEEHARQLLKRSPAMGGTFYPEENSLLNAFNVLGNTFFEKLETIEVDGELETIPNEENKIY